MTYLLEQFIYRIASFLSENRIEIIRNDTMASLINLVLLWVSVLIAHEMNLLNAGIHKLTSHKPASSGVLLFVWSESIQFMMDSGRFCITDSFLFCFCSINSGIWGTI